MISSESVTGKELYALVERLFPIHRSIAGPGVRATFDVLEETVPLKRTEIPTGTKVFDWLVPQEWSIQDAFIADATGRRVVDYSASNLHVVNHSQPVCETMNWQALKPHVHTCEERPEAIPYRTGYFRDCWGFCVTAAQFEELALGGPWQVVIDSNFYDGSLSLAECHIEGESDETFLLYAHTCHPSLANDNLSGISIAAHLAKWLLSQPRRYSYRVVFAPATIGAISWLAQQDAAQLRQIKSGLVLSLLGDSADLSFKQAEQEDCYTNRLVPLVLSSLGVAHRTIPFAPFGYDERQFASPGIQLPVGRLCRSEFGEFPEYHTSDDDLHFVTPEHLEQSFRVCQAIIEANEGNTYPLSLQPMGEPNLARHDLYRAFGERDDRGQLQKAMMWILNQADGSRDLATIAKRSKLSLFELIEAAQILEQHALLKLANKPQNLKLHEFQ